MGIFVLKYSSHHSVSKLYDQFGKHLGASTMCQVLCWKWEVKKIKTTFHCSQEAHWLMEETGRDTFCQCNLVSTIMQLCRGSLEHR